MVVPPPHDIMIDAKQALRARVRADRDAFVAGNPPPIAVPDQVRARLRAEGYPENLLDAYLSGADAGTEGTGTTGTSSQSDILNAVSSLGIIDTVDALTLRCSAQILSGDTTLTARDTVNGGREKALQGKRRLRRRGGRAAQGQGQRAGS